MHVWRSEMLGILSAQLLQYPGGGFWARAPLICTLFRMYIDLWFCNRIGVALALFRGWAWDW